MSSDQAKNAHKNPLDKKRIADEVADVFLYLIQIADHAEIDLEHAVIEKIEKNAIKHPANCALRCPVGSARDGSSI